MGYNCGLVPKTAGLILPRKYPGEDDFEKVGLDLFKEIMESNRHKVVDTAPDSKLRVVFKESEELLNNLSNVIPESLIEVKQGYIIVIIPENWTDDIFGEEI